MTSLQQYVNGLGLYSPLFIDAFTGSSEEMVIRHDPGTAKTVAYMDGSREGQFNFDILAKSEDPELASSQLSTLITSLDIRDDLQLTDLIRVKMEPVTTVRYVGKTESLEFIYSCGFTLEYFEKRS